MRSKPILGILFALLLFGSLATGCERKERILDIETPGGEVEVDRSLEDGDVEVDVNRE